MLDPEVPFGIRFSLPQRPAPFEYIKQQTYSFLPRTLLHLPEVTGEDRWVIGSIVLTSSRTILDALLAEPRALGPGFDNFP